MGSKSGPAGGAVYGRKAPPHGHHRTDITAHTARLGTPTGRAGTSRGGGERPSYYLHSLARTARRRARAPARSLARSPPLSNAPQAAQCPMLRRTAAQLASRLPLRALHTSAPVRAEPPCGAACATPTSCSAETPPARDIAYKPSKSGWGYSKAAAANWDAIFKPGSKKEKAVPPEASSAAS